MPDDQIASASRQSTIRLTGLQPGTSLEDMVPALQRLFPKKTPEKIRQAINQLPIILTRSVTKEQAKKIKDFLESKGAVVKISDSSSEARPVPQPEPEKKAATKMTETPLEALDPNADDAPQGIERRVKPRIHPGIRIHPMGIGEILDRSFRLLRQYFLLFFFIVLIPQGIYFLTSKVMQVVLTGEWVQNPTMTTGIGLGISSFFALVIFLILQFWAQGALIHAVAETYLGHKTSVGAAYGAIRRRLGRLLGTMMMMGFLMVLVPALGGILTAIFIPLLLKMGVGKLAIGLLVAVIIIFATVVFFHLLLNWLMVDKVVVLEEQKWRKALHRSKELMQASTEPGFWKSIKMKAGLILLLGFLIGIGIHLLLQIPGLIFSFITPGNLIVLTIQQILDIMATSLATVFTAIAMILYYYDIRLRKEGFDLKMMAANI